LNRSGRVLIEAVMSENVRHVVMLIWIYEWVGCSFSIGSTHPVLRSWQVNWLILSFGIDQGRL